MSIWCITKYDVKYYQKHSEIKEELLQEKVRFTKVTTEDWQNNLNKFLKHPGICYEGDFPDKYKKFYMEINQSKNHECPWDGLYCPPRGNVTKGAYMILGIAPGTSEFSFGESMWLLGPNSKYLHQLLEDNHIYPYFTDLFKKPFKNMTGDYINEPQENDDLNYTSEELITYRAMIEREIDLLNPEMVIFLGNYKEFKEIKVFLDNQGIKHFEIWHPSYMRYGHFDKWNANFKISQASKLANFDSNIIWRKDEIVGHGIEIVFDEEAESQTIAILKDCYEFPNNPQVIIIDKSASKRIVNLSGVKVSTEFAEAITPCLKSKTLPRLGERIGARKQFLCITNC
jgi:uracil-DNA glycosylase